MTSKREQVIDAVKALVAGALPLAETKRNLDKPERIPAGGLVIRPKRPSAGSYYDDDDDRPRRRRSYNSEAWW